jgi:hypothetical protein
VVRFATSRPPAVSAEIPAKTSIISMYRVASRLIHFDVTPATSTRQGNMPDPSKRLADVSAMALEVHHGQVSKVHRYSRPSETES